MYSDGRSQAVANRPGAVIQFLLKLGCFRPWPNSYRCCRLGSFREPKDEWIEYQT
jgi:hypothetical protein